MPIRTCGEYVSSFWRSSLALAMPRATTPATVAATAATAGTVRVRWRAASRAAYLEVSGSRPETRATADTTTGTTMIMPSTDTTADAAIQSAPLPESDVAAP